MSVITRFAPSPTGYLHIGGARTALFNYLFAKNRGGKFLLRIEDTDEKRSTKEAVDAILEGLSWLDIKHDGNFILQSDNFARHQEVVSHLLSQGKAYLCYCSQEEVEEIKKTTGHFKSPWREKNMSQASSVKPVVRIKAPLEGETIINDIVLGKVTVQNSELDDLVMLRSDGVPTYMLAVVVDDHDMNITHIIRGNEHFNNAFRQKVIYDAMQWKVPEFAHIPLIHAIDGTKMSKRHGATSVIDYKQMGYLPKAIRNYLLRLGWSNGDDEIISDENAIKLFCLENIGKSPSRFDFAKLNHLNKHYIKETSAEELINLSSEFFKKNLSENEKQRILKSVNFVKERAETISDLATLLEIYFDNFSAEICDEDKKILNEKKNLISDFGRILSSLENFTHDEIKSAIINCAALQNLKMKDFAPALRIAITFSHSSAGGIFDIIEILGRQEVARRLEISTKN